MEITDIKIKTDGSHDPSMTEQFFHLSKMADEAEDELSKKNRKALIQAVDYTGHFENGSRKITFLGFLPIVYHR